ncbi:MAG: type VI secretion system baseplate subunit TssE [Ketobacteraceae bacterium]|nr:type VI secretion system baseplate subunit TssE [Ketobacteraceae bacterium]
MKREQSLLLRLEDDRIRSQYTTETDIDKLMASISQHVQDMLNVRLGSVLALDDFGMPDFNDVVKEFPDAITRIRKAIRDYLTKYEPRLQHIHVEHLHDPEQPLLLKFAISGNLKGELTGQRASFTTVLTGSGQATVKV